VRITSTCLLLAALLTTSVALAQSSLPAPDPRFDGHVGRTVRDSDPPHFAPTVRPPERAPNIVLILLDDVGYGTYSAFGGGVPSPSLEKLAHNGLRFTRFHTAGICSPTRAALLTGRNPHAAGFGIVGELSTGYDGYTGTIPRSTATVAGILRAHGYSTAMFGKNHNTPAWEGGPAGPFDHWPNAFGFDYFYGFNGWGTSQWQPLLYENTRAIPPSSDRHYQLTRDLVDHSIAWMRNTRATNTGRPFLLYLATGAMHAPHHAPPEWIDRFRGQFDDGWDAYRQQTFARQKKLGVIPADTKLTPRPSLVQEWESLDAEQRRSFARQMEVFAAFGAYTDHEIGRLLDAVAELPDADNTLIVYIVGDNGASAEGGPEGTLNELAHANGLDERGAFTPETLRDLGSARFNNNYPRGWGWAMSTPFQYYKQVVSHLGAIRNPLVVSWPARIRDRGGVRGQFHFVSDIAPTLLEAAGIEMPQSVDGIAQKPLDGLSMLYSFGDANAGERRHTQYFEVFANRGIYRDGWFASAPLETDPSNPNRDALDPDKARWELYDLAHDFSQAVDLAAREPERLRALQETWWSEADRSNVLPLDWRAGSRMTRPRPNSVAAQKHFVYYPGMVALPEVIAPNLHNRSWTIAANGDFTPATHEGMLITQDGNPGGWALYLRQGRLVFDYNYGGLSHYRVASAEPVPANTKRIEARFAYDGKSAQERGLGGTLSLWADGRKLGEGRINRTLANVFSVLEGMDVGADYGSPVSDGYPFPFPYTGKLDTVTIDLE
jgi:arylsulfatase A-like enzyme